MQREDLYPTHRVRVAGLVPDGTAPVSKPKPRVGARAGEPYFPKKEVPINPRQTGNTRLAQTKTEHCGFNSRPFDVAFSGIERD
jgi:hypothetical protein